MSTPIATSTGTISVHANDLHAAVTKITRGLPAHGTRNPGAIEGLSLRSESGVLTLTVLRRLETLADVIVRHEMNCAADSNIDVVVPLRPFTKAVRALKMNLKRYASYPAPLTVSDNGVDLEVDGLTGHVAVADEMTVEETNRVADLLSAAPDSSEVLGTVTGAMLAEAWKRTHKAALGYGKDLTLPAMSHMQVVNKDGHLTVQATDRFRLATSSMQACEAGELESLMMPTQALNVSQLLATDNDVLRFTRDTFDGSAFVAIRNLHIEVFARVELSEFPDFSRIIPSGASLTATFDPSVMLDHLKLLKPHLDRTRQVILALSDGQVTLHVKGDHPQTRHMAATVTGLDDDDPDTVVAFNALYLMDALAARDGDVTLMMSAPSRPVLFLDSTDERIEPVPAGGGLDVVTLSNPHIGNVYLLMPIRLPG